MAKKFFGSNKKFVPFMTLTLLIAIVIGAVIVLINLSMTGYDIAENPATIYSKLPGDFNAVEGCYSPSETGGRVRLFNSAGNLQIYNPNNQQWYDRTGEKESFGLPTTGIPTLIYYDNLRNIDVAW